MNGLAFIQLPLFKLIADEAKLLNMPCYVVGGYVRDCLLSRSCKDIDFVVVGSGTDFAQQVAKKLSNKPKVSLFKTYGTAMLKVDDYEIEFVGARKESYNLNSRNPEVETGNLADDLSRRDFTINALAICLNDETEKHQYGEIIDTYNGLSHLENKLLKTPLNPDITFSDDPLRMMRAIRFASQLNFEIEAECLVAIEKNKDRISIISKERIADELNKIILSTIPSVGFKLLFETGLLKLIFPLMNNLHGVETVNGKSHKDNFFHTLQVLDNIAKTTNDLWLRWAAVLHDIAKPHTKRFEENIGWTFHGHEDKGARLVPKIFNELKLPLNEKMKYVQKLVQLHLRPIVLAQEIVTDSAVRRLLFEAGDDIDDLMLLCQADITTKNQFKIKRYSENFELVKQKLKEVEEKDHLRNWQPPISGEDIMQTFNLPPSKEIGIIKNAIREAILEGTIANDKTQATEFMLKFAESIGLKK